MTIKPLIAPSLLSADLSQLAHELKSVEDAGADWIHVDVMDGHFVPNLTFGPWIVAASKPHTNLPLDCHLMVSRPEEWINEFAQAGASMITVHFETTPHLHRLIQQIKKAGSKAGVSINPATPVELLSPILADVDLVLVMSVNPGFGGQSFIPTSLCKVEWLAQQKQKGLGSYLIEIDGGISSSTVKSAADAGCEVFVAGSAIYGQKDRKQAIHSLREAIIK
jgi:ribulose-phosphate 3-epimerase